MKIYVFLKAILDFNFDLIEHGAAHIKKSDLPQELQINICILVIDILLLLNQMKNMFLPNNLR